MLLAKLQTALISKELDMGSHIFPLYLFKCLFEELLLKSFLCHTIFSIPGGHPALVLNICKLFTTFPMLRVFFSSASPFDQMLFLFDVTSILSLHFTCLPSLLLTLCPSNSLMLFLTLKERGCPTYLCLGISLHPLHLP